MKAVTKLAYDIIKKIASDQQLVTYTLSKYDKLLIERDESGEYAEWEYGKSTIIVLRE